MSAEPDSGETAEKLADRPGPGPAARAPSAGRSEPIKNFNRVQDQSLVDWINTLKATGHNIQIRLHRVNPQAWQGRSIKGFLDSYDTPVDEEQIRNLWGGGTYTLKVMRRTDNGGGWVYFTSTTVDIAGDPRVDNLPGRLPDAGGKQAAPDESPLVSRMFDQSMSMMGKAVERAEKAAAGPGSAQIELMMRPYEMQMQATQRQLEATQAELREARRAPAPSKEDTFKDRWLEKLVDGDSARVTAVREQLQSELRQVKQSAIDDMKRAEDRWDRDMKLRELAFEREMKAKDAAHEMAMSNLKHSHDVTIKVLEGDNRRYERDNNELRLEVKALREKKDQSILDKAKEVEAIANAIGGGQAEEKEKSTIEKIAEVALTSDQLLNFFGKWFKPDGTPAPPPAGAAAQNANGIGAGPDLVRRRSTGEVFRKTAQGYVPVPQPRRRRAVAKVASAEGGVEGDEPEAEIEVDVDDMEKAKNFLEMAFRNNTDPDTVATSARSMVPEGILAVIRDLGVDGFLTKVAKLPSTSPLSTQLGRIWTRKLGKALLGGEE